MAEEDRKTQRILKNDRKEMGEEGRKTQRNLRMIEKEMAEVAMFLLQKELEGRRGGHNFGGSQNSQM